ncbi:MAG: NeuD/PglB/VioB family sugar acetyltransferase [Synergistaceae bacterium]|jgi:sugar O-acyltransferase (sialic acid O-acetyltransferase NeuD family)|nr:NeuD/PglB/VioB family sugar acetyltransferase [Synergistaceae bacterium]
MGKIVVCGAGGLGREIIGLLERMNSDSRWEIVGFSDASASGGRTIRGYPVMSEEDLLSFDEPIDAVIGVGFPASREKIFRKFSQNPHIRFPATVSPDSHVARGVELQEGTLITGLCSVSPDVSLGRGVLLNGYNAIGHDARIGDFSVVMAFSLIAGNVNIGSGVLVGAGSIITQGLDVGANAEICSGCVVVRDVKDGAKMMGNPARAI